MIPELGTTITTIEQITMPSKTYRIDEEANRIIGSIDGLGSILQSVKKILNTERYAYVIYDSRYGSELERLIGKPQEYVVADLERSIRAALMTDDRIQGIKDFTTSIDGTNLTASFTIISIEGNLTYTTEVIL